MALAIVNSALNHNDAGASVTLTVPTGTTTGNLMIAGISWYEGSGLDVITTPSGWTSIVIDNGGGANTQRAQFFYRVATSADVGGTTTYTFDASNGDTIWPSGVIVTVSGQASSGLLDGSVGNHGTSAAPAGASVSPTGQTDFLFTLLGVQVAGLSGPSSETELQLLQYTNNGHEGLYLGYKALTSSGSTGAQTGSTTNNSGWAAVTVAILAAPSADDSTDRTKGPRFPKYKPILAKGSGEDDQTYAAPVVDETIGAPLMRKFPVFSKATAHATGIEELPYVAPITDEPVAFPRVNTLQRFRPTTRPIGSEQEPYVAQIVDETVGGPLVQHWQRFRPTGKPVADEQQAYIAPTTDEDIGLPRRSRFTRFSPTRKGVGDEQELYAAPIEDEPGGLPMISGLFRFWPSWKPVGIEDQPYESPINDEPNALPRTRRFLRLKPTRLSVGDEQQSYTSPTVDEDVGQPRSSQFRAYKPTGKLIGDEQQPPLPVDDDRHSPGRRFQAMRMPRNQSSEASAFEEAGQTRTSRRLPKNKRWNQSSSDDATSFTIGDDGVLGFSIRFPKLKTFISRIVGWAEDFLFPPLRPSPVVLIFTMPLCDELTLNARLNAGFSVAFGLSHCEVLHMPDTITIPLRMPLSEQLQLYTPLR